MTETTITLDHLPRIDGSYRFNYALAPATWFRVGGQCDVLYRPADLGDLQNFLKKRSAEMSFFVMGVASNLLIRDGGIPDFTIRLGKRFRHIAVHNNYIEAGAGVLDRNVAFIAAAEGLENLEFLSGIPGTIGGALRMNAGCYGMEMQDILEVAFALDPHGRIHTLTVEDMGFSYRHCQVPPDWIFLGARLKAKISSPQLIHDKMNKLLAEREASQPVRTRTGGSTFANPLPQKAWELIDQAGCRGLKVGGAIMSDLHCNFMINTGEASAFDLELLGEVVRGHVREKCNIDLKWEIKRVGRLLEEQILPKAA